VNQALADRMKAHAAALQANPYPGRGIVLGLTPDGRNLVQVYWIMGRSENSRNRVFVQEGDVIRTRPHDVSKVADPSLIIYATARVHGACHVVTNGDQTDTVWQALQVGGTFEGALRTRTFEPDAPNYTPRISGMTDLHGPCVYRLSILKPAVAGDPKACVRQVFEYERAEPGVGHCLHTYRGDGNPLPAFEGEPYPVALENDLDAVAAGFWGRLNADNRISLWVKFVGVADGAAKVKIVNKLG
jgi:IMP cyclohydrolase